MLIFLIVVIVLVGNFYFHLHAIPEHRAHRTNKAQMEIVAILALLALFTHNHVFWIAALLLAFVQLPDFSTPLNSIAAIASEPGGKREAAPAPGTDLRGRARGEGAALIRARGGRRLSRTSQEQGAAARRAATV